MVRGTTPTFTFRIKGNVDLTQATDVYVTFSDMHEKELMTKTGNDLEITTESVADGTRSSVSVYLNQAETLSLKEDKVKIQINWTYQDGSKEKRAVTKKKIIDVDSNLLNKEL